MFARWVIRRDAPEALKQKLTGWLKGLVNNEDAYIAATAPAEALRVGIPEPEMAEYLKGIRRVLTDEDIEGQEIFLSELETVLKDRWFPKASTDVSVSPRADKEACIRLLREMPMGELAALAHAARMKRHPEPIVTYVMDTNPNYTNICSVKCRFCAFCKSEGDPDAYTLTPQALAEKVRGRLRQGSLHRFGPRRSQ